MAADLILRPCRDRKNVWWRKVQSTGSGAAKVAATRAVSDAMLLHNGVWGLFRSVTGGQRAADSVKIPEARHWSSARRSCRAGRVAACCRGCAAHVSPLRSRRMIYTALYGSITACNLLLCLEPRVELAVCCDAGRRRGMGAGEGTAAAGGGDVQDHVPGQLPVHAARPRARGDLALMLSVGASTCPVISILDLRHPAAQTICRWT